MASTLDTDSGATDSGATDPGATESGATDSGPAGSEAAAPAKRFSRALKTYAFIVAVILGVALGAGLRYVPATAAATPDDSSGPASTACAAQ